MQKIHVGHEYQANLLVNSQSLHKLLKKKYVISWNATVEGASHQGLATLPVNICYEKLHTYEKTAWNLKQKNNDKEKQARTF